MLSALEADRTRAAFLQAQIPALENSIVTDELRSEQALIQQRLQSYVYPVLTLPPEIVSEIFIRVLPPYPRCPPLTGPLSPTSLTQICRDWREIALSTPALWRAISSSLDNHIPFERQTYVWDLWLKRSRSCPLSIECDEDEETRLLKAATSHRTRWEYLKLQTFGSQLPAIAGGTPLLRHLDLQLHDSAGPPFAADVITFHELPLLRSAVLDDTATSWVILPWAQLTSLALNRVYLHECVPILKQTCNLVHCKLRIFSYPSDSGDIVTLPHLESLFFNDPSFRTPPTRYLESFATPALCSLRIQERSLGLNPVHSLTGFISRSGCKLQEVCITGQRVVARKSYREGLPSIPRLAFNKRSDPSAHEEDSLIEESSDISNNGDSE
ncbi:hypothetical protein K438DRAFT_1758761 [Mycena galopus ATCC 62051]|nr:hypothetical protein K438DRAFT_1758761 [Mycena galopus ATCC 62051]